MGQRGFTANEVASGWREGRNEDRTRERERGAERESQRGPQICGRMHCLTPRIIKGGVSHLQPRLPSGSHLWYSCVPLALGCIPVTLWPWQAQQARLPLAHLAL